MKQNRKIRVVMKRKSVNSHACELNDQALADLLHEIAGEGFHTMLRKGIDGHGSSELWDYIHDLPSGEWTTMLHYWIVEPFIDAVRAKRQELKNGPHKKL